MKKVLKYIELFGDIPLSLDDEFTGTEKGAFPFWEKINDLKNINKDNIHKFTPKDFLNCDIIFRRPVYKLKIG